jgi:hypothetical protein
MNLPVQTEPVLWGAAGGAVLLAVVGFGFGGWQTAAKSDALAGFRANTAVAKALAPVCAEAFRRDVKFSSNLADLKKADEWARSGLIEKGGWGKLPGAADLDSETTRACAAQLVAG